VVRRGAVVASWGDPTRVEMAFSATKSVLSLVAGVAYDDGTLSLDETRVRGRRPAAVHERPRAAAGMPGPLKKAAPLWYRLRRA